MLFAGEIPLGHHRVNRANQSAIRTRRYHSLSFQFLLLPTLSALQNIFFTRYGYLTVIQVAHPSSVPKSRYSHYKVLSRFQQCFLTLYNKMFDD